MISKNGVPISQEDLKKISLASTLSEVEHIQIEFNISEQTAPLLLCCDHLRHIISKCKNIFYIDMQVIHSDEKVKGEKVIDINFMVKYFLQNSLKSLAKNPLEYMHLTGSPHLNSIGLNALLPLLAKNETIKGLHLEGSMFDSSNDLFALLSVINTGNHVQSLSLSNYAGFVGNDAEENLQALLKGVEQNNALQEIDLSFSNKESHAPINFKILESLNSIVK